jgi:hypothetical protein
MSATAHSQLPVPCVAGLALAVLLGACVSTPESEGPPRKEMVIALTQGHELIRFNAGQPRRILERKPLRGLPAGEQLVGIDFRIARGDLYGLSRQGRLYTIDTGTGQLSRVGSLPLALPLEGEAYGFDFNPAADRIRVVAGSFNLRLHPDTAAAVDGDAATPGSQPDARLAYASGDRAAGRVPDIVGAAYTYNKRDEKLTTNYVLDRAQGTLVMQGSLEATLPVVSPNSGRLTTVGVLGLGPFADAGFDIADVTGAALAAVRGSASGPTRLYDVDLGSGRARLLGTVGDGTPIRGLAIEP